MNDRRENTTFCWMVAAFLGLAGTAARAQDGEPRIPYDPPMLIGETAQVSLLEAVRLTLDNDPNLLLRHEDVQSQFGLFQESSGDFDWTFAGEARYEHRERELTERVKAAEQGKRDQIEDAAAEFATLEGDLNTKIGELEATLNGAPADSITTDPGFEAQLRIVEALIAGAEDPVEEQLLQDTRENLIQTELEVAQEALRGATRARQDAEDARTRLGDTPDEEEFDIGRLDLRLEKLGRAGVFWKTFLKGAYNSTDYIGKRLGSFEPLLDLDGEQAESPSGIPLEQLIDFGGKNIEDLNSVEIGFEVNIPMLRNSGRDAVAAAETAARIDWGATELLYQHATTESVVNTVFAYWNLVAAQDRVRILTTSADRQSRVLEITRALIGADELPGVEESRAIAGEANARSQLQGAARDLIGAQLDLVTATGLTTQGKENSPTAETGFLKTPSTSSLAPLQQELVQEAMRNRRDIEAAKALTESGVVLTRAAEINLKPILDLTLGTSVTARGESSLSNALDRWTFPSWKAGLLYEKPIRNDTAKGQLLQRESQLRRRQINEVDLERQVGIAVVRTLHSLIEALDELAYAEEAARQFELTYATELEKLRLGETTVLDTTLTEQQRTRSDLRLVSARFQVATLIASLRFETGTLTTGGQGNDRITMTTLTGLPGQEESS